MCIALELCNFNLVGIGLIFAFNTYLVKHGTDSTFYPYQVKSGTNELGTAESMPRSVISSNFVQKSLGTAEPLI